MPQSDVYCLFQDSRGYIWAGTDGGGLARFDGRTFRVFNDRSGLSGNVVRSLLEDRKGNLWIGTDNGITLYDGYSFTHIGEADSLKGTSVLSLLEDRRGRIWAGTDDGGLNCITRHGDSLSVENYNADNGLSGNVVFDLYEDALENIWACILYGGINVLKNPAGEAKDAGPRRSVVIMRGGIELPTDLVLCMEEGPGGDLWFGSYDRGAFRLRLNAATATWDVLTYPGIATLASGTVWNIRRTSKGDLWFGTGDNGVGRLFPDNSDTITERNFAVYNASHGLPINQVITVMEDREGTVWLGTNGGGLVKYFGDHFAHYSAREGLAADIVMGMDQDKEGNFWIVTDGGGLSILSFRGDRHIVRNLTEKDGLPGDYLTGIAIGKTAHNPHVWLSTVKDGIVKFDGKKFYRFTEQDGLKNDMVNGILVDDHGIVWCATAGGISRFDGSKFTNASTESMIMSDEGVKCIIEGEGDVAWFGTAGGLARYDGLESLRTFDEVEGLAHKDVNALCRDARGNIIIGTNDGGIYRFNIGKPDTLAIEHLAGDSLLSSNTVKSLAFADDRTLIAGTGKGFDRITFGDDGRIVRVKSYDATDNFLGIECNKNAILRDAQGRIWLGTAHGLTRYDPLTENRIRSAPQTHITALQLFFKDTDWLERADSTRPFFNLPVNLQLPYDENHLTFHFTGLSFINPDKILYSYLMEGEDGAAWSPPSAETKATFSGMKPGGYVFKVRSMNADGMWTEEPALFRFITIHPPWWQTAWFYITCAITAVIAVIVFIKVRERKLKEEKRVLEQIVAQRTREVVHQKEIIEEKNKDILDSITYAKRIQTAVLPPDRMVKSCLRDAFILYKPKDIVSGDFYWVQEDIENIYYAAVDCTGHGVPGAFVSIVGYNGLNRTVREFRLKEPGAMLDKLTEIVEENLRQKENEVKDGMDIALCVFDRQRKAILYSGANNPLYIVRKKGTPLNSHEPSVAGEVHDLYEIKADRQPIGKFENRSPFVTHRFALQPGDSVYTFSDGFADQFGGNKGKKFKYKTFKELILSLQNLDMEAQKEALDGAITGWMATPGPEGKTHPQIDDICVIGVRF